jgi:hypothetical protein
MAKQIAGYDAADGGEFAAILRHEDAVLTSKSWVGTGLEEPT